MKFIKEFTREYSPEDFLDGLEKKALGCVTVGKRTREVSRVAPARKKMKL